MKKKRQLKIRIRKKIKKKHKECLVSGSRYYSNERKFFEKMDKYDKKYGPFETIVQGEARGADELARQWAESRKRKVIGYKANWSKYGRAAGSLRNSQMLNQTSATILLSFPLQDSVGTWDMVRKARIHDLKVIVVGRKMYE